MNVESSVIPLLASPQGGVAERLKRFRGASADREAGVVFRLRTKKENRPVCAEQGSFATSYLTAQPPLLAVMQGGEYSSACNSFTPSLARDYIEKYGNRRLVGPRSTIVRPISIATRNCILRFMSFLQPWRSLPAA